MSAFLVSNETMQRAVEAIFVAEAGYGDVVEVNPKAATELGQQLFEINQAALAARYGDNDEPPKFVGKGFTARIKAGPAQVLNVQRLKSLQCLTYQCAEGDVPETALFKRAEAAEGKLAQKIVAQTPEYEKAAWS
jgi:hypothetical protein